MCNNFKVLDVVALQSNMSVNRGLVASTDSRYCIITEEGFYILHLCGLMDSISPSISLKKSFITIQEYSASVNLGIDLNSFVNELPQDDLYETILNLDISEKVKDAANIKQQPVQVKWSPQGLVSNNHSCIASLTNRGSLDIFVSTVNEVQVENYISYVNITKNYIDYLRSSWVDKSSISTQQLQILKWRLNEVLPTAFEWSNMFQIDDTNFCLLFVGHLNSNLTIWQVDQIKPNQINGSGVKLISTYKTDLKRITALHWQQIGNHGFLLGGDLEGNVKLMPIRHTENGVLFDKDLFLWNETDNILVEYFKVLVDKEMTYVFIIKGSFLLICLINELGDILDIHNLHVGNMHISGVEHLQDNIVLVVTNTGIIKEIKLIVEANKLQIEWRHIYLDFPWNLYRTHGLAVSQNKVFMAILVSMAKINDIRRKKGHIKLVIFKNMNRDPLKILMNNSSESLEQYWDCLEILRLNGVIEKKLPCDGLPSGLDYDKLSILQLKTCLWLSKSSEVLQEKIHLLKELSLLRSDEIKYILKIRLACKHLQRLFDKLTDCSALNEFHMQSIDIINMYLKEAVMNDSIPSLGLGKNTISELTDAISAANELRYPAPPKCSLCSEDLIGTSCIPPHMDTRCSISFMQVLNLPYYKCPLCSSVVHWKMSEIYNFITCPFCDLLMDLVSTINGDNFLNKSEISLCNVDCNEQNMNLNPAEIEDHAFVNMQEECDIDLFAVSSSEEEYENTFEDNTNDVSQVVLETMKPQEIKYECTSIQNQ